MTHSLGIIASHLKITMRRFERAPMAWTSKLEKDQEVFDNLHTAGICEEREDLEGETASSETSESGSNFLAFLSQSGLKRSSSFSYSETTEAVSTSITSKFFISGATRKVQKIKFINMESFILVKVQ